MEFLQTSLPIITGYTNGIIEEQGYTNGVLIVLLYILITVIIIFISKRLGVFEEIKKLLKRQKKEEEDNIQEKIHQKDLDRDQDNKISTLLAQQSSLNDMYNSFVTQLKDLKNIEITNLQKEDNRLHKRVSEVNNKVEILTTQMEDIKLINNRITDELIMAIRDTNHNSHGSKKEEQDD